MTEEKNEENEKQENASETGLAKKILKNPKVIIAVIFGVFILVLTIINLDETDLFQFFFWKMNVKQIAYIYTPATLLIGFLGGYLYCKHRTGSRRTD